MTVFEMNDAINDAFTGKMDKYAIYLRKSRADIEAEKLGEGETLTRHKMILTELAARKGFYIEKIYQEIVSGETIEAREEIQKLINDCYAGKYRGILVIDITRLSRGNQGDAQTILDCLKFANNNNGVLVITPTKTYDVAHNHDDEEYMEFELFMSRREYKMIRKRMERGKLQAVVEGNYISSSRPYGYNILKTKTGRTLIPNDEEAPVVKQIFEWTIKNNSTPGKIARRLTAMGVPTYTGMPEWSDETIRSILQNPVYTGKVRWNNRMAVKRLVDGELVKSRPRWNHNEHYIEVDGKHKQYALIDDETFKKAGQRFHSDKTRAGLKLVNPLAGILCCAKCGRPMMYMPYVNNPTPPRLAHRHSQTCKVKSAIASDVIEAVVHGLKLYIEDFEMKIDEMPEVDENAIADQIDALQKEIKKIKKKLSKLFDAWENDDITDNEFVQRKAVNNARIDAIKNEIEELENTIPEKEEHEDTIMKLSDALDALLDEELEASVKNTYLKEIVSKIEFSRENNKEFILDIILK
jgi:DNA invertase Pin-like site-specific DNA recombinase